MCYKNHCSNCTAFWYQLCWSRWRWDTWTGQLWHPFWSVSGQHHLLLERPDVPVVAVGPQQNCLQACGCSLFTWWAILSTLWPNGISCFYFHFQRKQMLPSADSKERDFPPLGKVFPCLGSLDAILTSVVQLLSLVAKTCIGHNGDRCCASFPLRQLVQDASLLISNIHPLLFPF